VELKLRRYIMDNLSSNGLGQLPLLRNGSSRSINAENPNGEKGRGGMAASHLGNSRKGSPCIRGLEPGSSTTLANITGSGIIQHIWITVTDRTEKDHFVLRDIILKMYWDDEKDPSVEVPLGDFFCNGFGRYCQINSQPIAVNPTRGMNCYFPMPFKKRARIVVENRHEVTVPAFFYQIDYCLTEDLPKDIAYFHANWRREKITQLQQDYTILDQVTGKGHFVGMYIALTTLERYWYGEGEVKMYIDGDDNYPTICGTGMEDYFGGAWSFAEQIDGETVERTYCTPYMGYPYYSKEDKSVHSDYYNNDTPPQRGFYRWHILDPILFDESIRVTIQQIGTCHKGNFERQDDLSSVAYWYQTEPHKRYDDMLTKEQRRPR